MRSSVGRIKALIAIVLLVFVVLAGLKAVAPSRLKRFAVEGFEKVCATCKAEIGEASLSLFPLGIAFARVHLETGVQGDSLAKIDIERISSPLSFSSLFSKVLRFKKIEIERPTVLLAEGILQTPPAPLPESSPSDWRFICEAIVIRAGDFQYENAHQNRRPDTLAKIGVHDIQAQIDRFGSTPELRSQPASASIKARLEQSGKVDLTLTSFLFAEELSLGVRLQLDEMNLSEMNRYFDVNDGVHLEGRILRSLAEINVRGRELKGAVRTTYAGLKVKFRKMEERSGLSALFSSFVSSIKIDRQNVEAKPSERVRGAELQRLKTESLVTFILRGMKTAALDVATSS